MILPKLTRHTTLVVFLFFATLYLFTMNGYIANTDAETMYQVTRSLVERGDVAVEPGLIRQLNGREGADGRFYAWYGIGQSLIGVPFYALGKVASVIVPLAQREFFLRFATVAVNVVMAAAWVTLVFRLCLLLDPNHSRAVIGAALFGLGTSVWPYSKLFFSEPSMGFFLTACTYYAVLARRRVHAGSALLAGLALAGAILTRPQAVLLVPLVVAFTTGIAFLPVETRNGVWRRVAGTLMAPMAAVLLTGWYNWIRFGSPLNAGIPSFFNLTNIPVALYGVLFSSGKSIFIFAPLMVLTIAGIPDFFRKFRSEAAFMGAMAFLYILPSIAWKDWDGGVCWGPRYLLPITAFAVFPAMEWARNRCRLRMLVAISFLGVLVQLPAVIMRYDLYISEVGRTEITNYNPRFFPVAGQWGKLNTISLTPLPISLDDEGIHEPAFKIEFSRTPDVWLAYLWRMGMNKRLLLAALVAQASLLILLGMSLISVIREGSSGPSGRPEVRRNTDSRSIGNWFDGEG